MMRPSQDLLYVVMSTWMFAAAIYRVALQLSHGYPLDALPFVSVTLSLTSLILLAVERRTRLALYVALAVWLPFGSVVRVVLQIMEGQPLEPIPAVSLILGLVGISFLFAPAPVKGEQ